MKKVCLILALVFAVALTASATEWSVPGDFTTIQVAIDNSNVLDGDTIFVAPGEWAGATVTKAVEIRGEGQAVINYGPECPDPRIQSYGFRLLTSSGGTTISHFRFEGVDLAVYGVSVNDISVSQCTFINSVQAISNWGGSRWNIDHNEIIDLRTRSGGGIGILIADRTGVVVEDNVVAHNKIYGTLHVWDQDCGGYSGCGIVLYADFRYGWPGAEEIAWNRVIKNKISLVSGTPDVVDVEAFELADMRDEPDCFVVHGNSIGFNDFRGTADQIAFYPPELENCNKISRNLGDNRGHGLRPKVLFASENE